MLKIGNDLKLYYNSGTTASPTWVLICQVGDVTIDFNRSLAEVDLRCSQWLLNLAGKMSGMFNFSLANNFGNTVYDALRVIAFSGVPVQLASADGAIATVGTEYFKAYVVFSQFPWAQPTQEMSSHDAQAGLAWVEESGNLVEPSWVEVSA